MQLRSRCTGRKLEPQAYGTIMFGRQLSHNKNATEAFVKMVGGIEYVAYSEPLAIYCQAAWVGSLAIDLVANIGGYKHIALFKFGDSLSRNSAVVILVMKKARRAHCIVCQKNFFSAIFCLVLGILTHPHIHKMPFAQRGEFALAHTLKEIIIDPLLVAQLNVGKILVECFSIFILLLTHFICVKGSDSCVNLVQVNIQDDAFHYIKGYSETDCSYCKTQHRYCILCLVFQQVAPSCFKIVYNHCFVLF